MIFKGQDILRIIYRYEKEFSMMFTFIETHRDSFLDEDEELYNIYFTQDGLQILFIKDEKKFINFISWMELLNFINNINGHEEYKGNFGSLI